MADFGNEVLSPELIRDVIEHMNADHTDSLKDYAEAFASIEWADHVFMTSLSTSGIELQCESNTGRTRCITIGFDKVLMRPEQVRGALVALAKRARSELGS